MAEARLIIETISRTNYEEGEDYFRRITRYTPHLGGAENRCPLFSGKISFAFFEAWEDDPEPVHEEAKGNALNSAKEALAIIAVEATQAMTNDDRP